jgi:transposase InsO family protein
MTFRTLGELTAKLRRWEHAYNHQRPHLALAGTTPAERVCELKVTLRPVQATA